MKTWLAPAKLNLFLHVVGRRADGFHELQTLFQLLDVGDLLSFEVTEDSGIRRNGGSELPQEDLCVRAARALQQAGDTDLGARIQLTKRIPVGAGLGGGSSDAAITRTAQYGRARVFRTGVAKRLRYAADARTPHCGARTSAAPSDRPRAGRQLTTRSTCSILRARGIRKIRIARGADSSTLSGSCARPSQMEDISMC